MAEGIWNWLTTFVLVAIVLLILLFAFYAKGTGLFAKLADVILKQSSRFLPIEPRKELKQDEKLPQLVINSQEKFTEFLKLNIGKSGTDKLCRLETDSLSGLGDIGLELTNLNNNLNIKLTKIKSSEGYLALNVKTVENAQACLINSESFYNCYIGANRQCEGNMYNNLDILRINNQEARLNSGNFQLAKYNGKIQMIRIDNNKFCFMPLHSGFGTPIGCDPKKLSLDNDCVQDIVNKIPLCGKSIEPDVLSDKDKSAVEEFTRFVAFVKGLGAVQDSKICRKDFFFNTRKIEAGYYLYISPNGQIDLIFNKDGGKIIKREAINYLPYGALDSDLSLSDSFNKYDIFKDTIIISPAGDYSPSEQVVAVLLEPTILAVNNGNNKWFLTKQNNYISAKPICA